MALHCCIRCWIIWLYDILLFPVICLLTKCCLSWCWIKKMWMYIHLFWSLKGRFLIIGTRLFYSWEIKMCYSITKAFFFFLVTWRRNPVGGTQPWCLSFVFHEMKAVLLILCPTNDVFRFPSVGSVFLNCRFSIYGKKKTSTY